MSDHFNDYTINVKIEVRRQESRYDSATLADVTFSNLVTLSPDDVGIALKRAVSEAHHKAELNIGLKRDFEDALKALNAGDADATEY